MPREPRWLRAIAAARVRVRAEQVVMAMPIAGGWLAQFWASQYPTRDVLRHADAATTRAYVNPVSEMARAAAEALGQPLMEVLKDTQSAPERPALRVVK